MANIAPKALRLARPPAPSGRRARDAGYAIAGVVGDPGPAQRVRHDAVVLEDLPTEEGGGRRARVTTQRPLDRYLHRGEISAEEHAAGNRLRADFERAGLQARITMHYAPRLPPSGVDPRDNRIDARNRFYAALNHVGPLGEGVLWNVCCADETAGDYAHRQGRHPRDGIVLLRAALGELARHYDGAASRHR